MSINVYSIKQGCAQIYSHFLKKSDLFSLVPFFKKEYVFFVHYLLVLFSCFHSFSSLIVQPGRDQHVLARGLDGAFSSLATHLESSLNILSYVSEMPQ